MSAPASRQHFHANSFRTGEQLRRDHRSCLCDKAGHMKNIFHGNQRTVKRRPLCSIRGTRLEGFGLGPQTAAPIRLGQHGFDVRIHSFQTVAHLVHMRAKVDLTGTKFFYGQPEGAELINMTEAP